MRPKYKKVIKFKLNRSFKVALQSEGAYLCGFMPVWITPIEAEERNDLMTAKAFSLD